MGEGGGRGEGEGEGGRGEGGASHLNSLVEENLAEQPEGGLPVGQQVGLPQQHLVGGRVVDRVVDHVLLQRLEVVLQVVAHHQFASQELQDLAGKTRHPRLTQGPPRGPGATRRKQSPTPQLAVGL